ncbi:hypothetical protein EV363DRAFT_1331134 [Boletus edulis]|nr:hypothetical protein EV363DRAFT_1331134 [Boletus edulis]
MLSSAFVFLTVFAAAAQAGKRGLCWPYCKIFNNGDGEVVAIYDYETYAPPSTNGNGGLGFIGMQRCLDCTSSPIADLYSRLASPRVGNLNEPDVNGITPSQAASWYIQYINPLTIRKALPAVTSSTASGQGLSWLSEMIAACAGQCYFDYINAADSRLFRASLYIPRTSFAEFQSFVEFSACSVPMYNYQLVITEFALTNPPGGQADQVTFFQQAFAFLDSAAYVQLYFPFVATSPSLLQTNDPAAVSYVGTGSCLYNNDGSPSAVGNLMY